ncbi:serine/threonine-protein kinase [Sanguibacter suaedae]|uniref:Protein kinase n=1 Tax=Sanguibacter suaedae TaxID=2795737 RepID=A0A934I2S4_9MICO|nr:serine/threonine-protein kinase [Sanguibacter suaedae]MBI9114529.1 protein kinase [Sanguibacter suaedae]
MERIGLDPGTEIGGYRILSPLGSGAMGVVYRAVDGGGHPVAFKLMHPNFAPDAEMRARLGREVAALQKVDHPAVAHVLDAEADSSEMFIVTQLVNGPTLESEIADGGPLDETDLHELASQLHEALAAVHAAGVIHRDLKPSNVLVSEEGPVLIDFGIAHGMEDARMTSPGFVMGTPGYLAPELVDRQDPSPATDWWGWAALLVYAATGRAPFGVRPLEAVLARARSGDPDTDGLGPRTTEALRGALAADPADRLAPADVVEALRVAAVEGDAPVVVDDAPPTLVVAAPPAADGAGPGEVDATAVLAATDADPTAVLPQGEATTVMPAADATAVHDGGTRVLPVTLSAPEAASVPYDPHEVVEPPPYAAPYGTVPSHRAEPDSPPPPPSIAPGHHVSGPSTQDIPLAPVSLPYSGRPARRRRTGTVLALALPFVAAGATYPGWALVALLVVVLVCRVVGTAEHSLHARRERRGARPSDPLTSALLAPWHLLRALVASVPSTLVAASAVVVLGGTSWWLLTTDRLVVPPSAGADGTAPGGGNEPWVYSTLLMVVVLVAAALLWFGPVTLLARQGARVALGAVAPGWLGSLVAVLVALVVTAFLVSVLLGGEPVHWAPLQEPPSFAS